MDALAWVAGIRARNGNLDGALELIRFIQNHPKTDTETIQNIQEILPLFSESMNAATVRGMEKGKACDLNEVIDEVLNRAA